MDTLPNTADFEALSYDNVHAKNRVLTITIKDPQVIEILNTIPEQERDRFVERYIVLGDTVARYASITASDNSVQKFFSSPVQQLHGVADALKRAEEQLVQMLPDKIDAHTNGIAIRLQATIDDLIKQVNGLTEGVEQSRSRIEGSAQEGVKRLEDRIPETIKSEISAVSSQMQQVVADFQQLKTDLSQVIPALKTSSKRGKMAEATILQSLCESFKDCIFDQVAAVKQSTDIQATLNSLQHPIRIEVKDYTKDVPSEEVEKFWRDMEQRNARVGCFVSMQSRIGTVTSDFMIVRKGRSTGIFIVDAAFDHQGHIYAFRMARHMAEMLEAQSQSTDDTTYDIIVRILNNQLRSLKSQVDELKDLENTITKTQQTVNDTLGKLITRATSIRSQIETTVDSALRDFSNLPTS